MKERQRGNAGKRRCLKKVIKSFKEKKSEEKSAKKDSEKIYLKK